MLCNRAEHCNRQEEERPDYKDRPEHEEAEGGRVIIQGPQTGRARFFRPEKSRHGNRRDNRQKAAEKHNQPGCDVPGDGFRRRTRTAGETEAYS